ncbi:MAG TPA: arylsulfotransferase family protein [Arenibaculum sp.]|nr:arylsulfotransferase family protein [Arenibaculum sp.]
MIREKISFFLFVAAAAFLAYWFGFATAHFGLPPRDLITSSYAELSDFKAHWRNDLGFEPTRFLVPAATQRPPGFTAVNPDAMAEGYRLVAGYLKDRPSLNGAALFDTGGSEVHFWPIDYATLDPKGRDPRLVFLHGFEVFPDGSIVVNFDNGNVIARIAACGDVMWTQQGDFHHAVTRSHDGTLWALEADRLTQLDAGTGARLRHVELRENIIDPNGATGIFGMRYNDDEFNPGYMDDPFHPNDVEILSPEYAAAFADFEAGDIMISLRSLNLVAVIDGRDLRLKWYQHGPWHRQHDPDFMPDGTISVFDNNMHAKVSRILRIDPATRRYEVAFEGSDAAPFYTGIRGKHETLANGNILVTEPQGGRAFEVDAGGNLVWEYRNTFDDDRNLLINKAMVLPTGFFEAGAIRNCGDPQVAAK